MNRRASLLSLVLVALLGSSSLAADDLPSLADDPRLAGSGLALTRIADNLDFPKALAPLPDGSLLVGVNEPTGGFFDSTGAILRLADHDGDGVVDGDPTTVANDLSGQIVALAVAGDLVIATSSAYGNEGIEFLRRGATWDDPLAYAGRINLTMPDFLHQSYGLAVRETPDETGAWDLIFNIGSSGNEQGGGAAILSGLVDAEVPDASLIAVTIRDDGASVSVSPPRVIATGLRNAAAFVIDPATGDLVITDNGIDGLVDPTEPLSADEIDVIRSAQIGTEVADFGYPGSYVAYRNDDIVGGGGNLPLVVFQPLDGSEAEGPSAIALAPAAFPAWLAGKAIVGFHGQFDEVGLVNEENPVRAVDLTTGEQFDLIPNDDPHVGHIDAIVAAGETVYLADLCADGSLSETASCGALYAIRATPGA